jgi:hypothetical protein
LVIQPRLSAGSGSTVRIPKYEAQATPFCSIP